MKTIRHLLFNRQFWTIELMVVVLILGRSSTTRAQSLQSRITLSDADSSFEQILAQPADFLKRAELSLEEIQGLANTRSAIRISGAGFVRNVGLIWIEDVQIVQPATSSIRIEGAGSTHSLGLAPFVQVSSLQESNGSIHIANAGFVRDIGLVSPLSLVVSTPVLSVTATATSPLPPTGTDTPLPLTNTPTTTPSSTNTPFPTETATAISMPSPTGTDIPLPPTTKPTDTPSVEASSTMTPVLSVTATAESLASTSTIVPSAQSAAALPGPTETSPFLGENTRPTVENINSNEPILWPLEIWVAIIGAVAVIVGALIARKK